jgi:hypothetical protein
MEQVVSELTAEGNTQAAQFLRHWETQLAQVLNKSSHSHTAPDRGQAYLQLIQALLECPKGSETEVLAAHRALVDRGLVQMMHQVAVQMATQGDRETASFLENLAAELSQGLGQVRSFSPHPESESTPAELLHQSDRVNPQRHPASVLLPQPQPGDRFAPHGRDYRIEPPHSPLTPIPDFWSQPQPDRAVTPAQTLAETTDLPTEDDQGITASPPVPAPVTSVPATNLEDRLMTITESLTKLVDTLAARINTPNPLWYLDVLERAHTANWILTTEEIEQLIGVKPHCAAGQDFYQRGGWIFTKVGKAGLQTAWKVTKAHSEEEA